MAIFLIMVFFAWCALTGYVAADINYHTLIVVALMNGVLGWLLGQYLAWRNFK